MTFSIVARCPRSETLGVATSSRALAAGANVPYARAGIGAIASQSFGNPYLAIDGLNLLASGLSPTEVLTNLLPADPGRDMRQVLMVDARGRTAAHTGSRCIAWCGHLSGPGYAVGGNILVGQETIRAMAEAFEASSEEEELPERLMRALEAGQAAGGDRRGRQSAGLLVVDREEYPYLDVRVDDHPDPVLELRRVFEVAKHELAVWGPYNPTREVPWHPRLQELSEQIGNSLAAGRASKEKED